METNNQRLNLLLKFINIALWLIVISIIISLSYSYQSANKYAQLAERLPSSDKFDSIRNLYSSISYLMMAKVILFRIFLTIILLSIRKIIISILSNGAFLDSHAKRIRKIALYYLWFAGVLLFFSLITILAAYNKGNDSILAASFLNLINIFENYVLTSLIAFGIAEIFIAGLKLQQEQELTI